MIWKIFIERYKTWVLHHIFIKFELCVCIKGFLYFIDPYLLYASCSAPSTLAYDSCPTSEYVTSVCFLRISYLCSYWCWYYRYGSTAGYWFNTKFAARFIACFAYGVYGSWRFESWGALEHQFKLLIKLHI